MDRQNFRQSALPYLKRVFGCLDVPVRFFHNDAQGLVCAPYLAEIGVNLFNFAFEHSLGVRALAVQERGLLRFQFVDGLALHVTVFYATRFEGDPVETDEAIPMWTRTDAIPYEEMWADDRVWMPELLAGRRFALRAVFDGDLMLDHKLEWTPA